MNKMYFFMSVLILFFCFLALKMYLFPAHKAHWISEVPIAHRGFFDNDTTAPENSLKAFKKAVSNGYAIEFDVHLTKDGHVIVHHDFTLERLSGVNKRIDTLNLKEIQFHKLLNTTEVPPTLKEVLELVSGRVPIFVEIKHETYEPAGKLEEETYKLLNAYEGRVAILSFNSDSIRWFAENAPHLYRGQNYDPSDDESNEHWLIFKSILSQAWVARPHFFVYNHKKMPKLILKTFSKLRPLLSYNVKSQDDYKHALAYADNVIFEKLNL